MATEQKGEKKNHILQNLASMLENPKSEKITTAALAAKIGVSEAALYRHFASKAQMFEGLIDFIETTIFSLINRITEDQSDGIRQAQEIAWMLLQFSARNPGMTKVMTSHALTHEDPRLQLRINHFIDRIELAFKQSLRLAVVTGRLQETEAILAANLMTAFIVGRWHRFVTNSFQHDPTDHAAQYIALIFP